MSPPSRSWQGHVCGSYNLGALLMSRKEGLQASKHLRDASIAGHVDAISALAALLEARPEIVPAQV
jgi:hypothetical protein